MNKIKIYYPFNDSSDNIKILSYFQQIQQVIVTSSFGPYGKLKLLSQSQNTQFNLSNSSKYLIKSCYKNSIETSNEYLKWLFELIQQTIQLHVQSNLDLGLSTVYLVNEFYIFHAKNTTYSQLIETVFHELYKLLRDSNTSECGIKLKLDLTNLKQLKILFQSILNTKTIYRLNIKDDSFLNLILKANLNSFCENNSKRFSSINYLFNTDNFQQNLNSSELFDGILISVDNLNNLSLIESLIKIKKNKKQLLKCVLFDTQLSADFEKFDFENYSFEINLNEDVQKRNVFLFIEKLKSMCDILLSAGVDIVLCQKVIHPSIKSYLFEKQCIPIDRVSITYTNALAELTGCKICKSAFNSEQFNDSLTFGCLTSLSIRHLTKISKTYLHFENETINSSQTMIVCLPNEIYVDEIQHLLKVTESCFQRSILSGYVLTGGPCFYSYIICYLYKYLSSTERYSKPKIYAFMLKIKSIFVNILKHLLKHPNKLFDYHINTGTGHVYNNNSEYCECGVFKINTKNDEHKMELFEDQNINLLDFNNFLIKSKIDRAVPNYLDCYESRLNSLRLIKTLLVTIFQIGVFIND